ncbi:MAG: molybdopterin-guanine dinucleotide biosynthesis protein B [Pseudomonadota bacterium]
MNIYGIVGWKNAGKTTLVERLVHEIAGRGYSVSTLKHTHHAVDLDQPGKDTYRHREAGAQQTLLASSTRWALLSELRGAPEPSLESLIARFDPVDLVLVEGFKRDRHPKIEAWRAAVANRPPIAADDASVRALATNDTPPFEVQAPRRVLSLDAVGEIADFLLDDLGLARRRKR